MAPSSSISWCRLTSSSRQAAYIRAWGFTTIHAAYTNRAWHLSQIPNNLSWESAATLFSSVSTIANSLFSRSPSVVTARLTPPWEAGGPGKYAGKAFFVIGGASNVGQYGASSGRVKS